MRREELDRAVAEASPITDADVAGFDFERAEAELIQEIIASPSDADAEIFDTPWARRRFTRGRAAVAVAGVAAAVAVTFVGIGSLGGDDRPAFAAEAIKVAEANPRLLVTEPGWSVTRADEFTIDSGEMTFSNGSDQLDVFWRPAGQYNGYLDDRAGDSSSQSQIQLLGHAATMFRYDDTFTGAPDFTTLLPPQGQSFAEIRGDALGSQQAYLSLIDTLQPTDVDTWLAAMPASVVKPVDRTATVDQMLEGIPLPPGFDVSALEHGATISDRYQLGALVAGAVACEWLDRWTAAAAAGDTAKVEQAKQAMATSRTWPILLEMSKQGYYPQEVWDWRNRLGDSGHGAETTRNYSSSLGCGTR